MLNPALSQAYSPSASLVVCWTTSEANWNVRSLIICVGPQGRATPAQAGSANDDVVDDRCDPGVDQPETVLTPATPPGLLTALFYVGNCLYCLG